MLGISAESLDRVVREGKARRRAVRRERIATAIFTSALESYDLVAPVRSSLIAGAIDLANELMAQLDAIEAQEKEEC